ncbi:peptidase M16 inactive domain-containing protein [Colletotrichum incanum]|nr:peptidase M16 inactive domain-containing protein [Colletotrichum incanum]
MTETSTDLSATGVGGSSPVQFVTDQLEAPLQDKCTYRVVQLPNGLEALLVHDPEADKASAALTVKVGSLNNDEDLPGTAHALEHLIQMGSKKFPKANEYSVYVQNHSGQLEAVTTLKSTIYCFSVSAQPANGHEPSDLNPSALRGGLDRFANCFVAPLLLGSSLDSELNVVHSEYKRNLQNDNFRIAQVEQSLSNPKHPYHRFSTGNLESLKTRPEAKGVNVRAKIIEFHRKHYSANRMKLIVLGREPLDVLQEWVAEFFSGVPNRNLVPNRWEDETPLREDELGTQIRINPVMDVRLLKLVIPFLDQEPLFKSQPGRYVSHLIGHEAPGSIMAFTKAKGWVNRLGAFFIPIGSGTGDLFVCQFHLTEERSSRFSSHVSLLKEETPQKWVFDELQIMADYNFNHKEKIPEISFTYETSSRMQEPLPREWLLSGNTRLRNFDPSLITEALACLRPDNFRLTLVSQTFRDCDQVEEWYDTKYSVQGISRELMGELEKAASSTAADRPTDLHLPHRNEYLPFNLKVDKTEVREPTLKPAMIRNDDLRQMWFKKDDTFWTPKAIFYTSLQNPVVYATAENCLKTLFITYLLEDALVPESSYAKLAGLRYSMSLDARGVCLDVAGYNDRLATFLEKILIKMRDLEIQEERFVIFRERIKKYYINWELQTPCKQVSSEVACLHLERKYTVGELLAELPRITLQGLLEFKECILQQLHIQSYCIGNLCEAEVRKKTAMTTTILQPHTLPPSQRPVVRSLIFPPGSNYVYEKVLKDPKNENQCVEYCLYIGDKGNPLIRTKTMLFDQLSREPAFHQLRTEESLGYFVESKTKHFWTTCVFSLIIQSQRAPEYLESRIDAFLTLFGNKLLSMPEEDFETHKRSVINKLVEKPKNLDEESKRHWNQIITGYCDFERDPQDAEETKNLTMADMIAFYNEYIKPGSVTRAKLAVYLRAQAPSLNQGATAEGRVDGDESEGGAPKPICITSIENFRAALLKNNAACRES